MANTIQETGALKIELQYLPSLAYIACLMKFGEVWIETDERYVKQTFRNRCRVLTANKVDTLTVPVKAYSAGALTKDVKIDHDQDWVRRHWGCLKSAYGKSPYFEFYAHEFQQAYSRKNVFLADLNYDLLTICLRLVGVKNEIKYKLSGLDIPENQVVNAVSALNGKKGDENNKYYMPIPYYQTFGNDFVANLSIVDLIFNLGPEAKSLLSKSQK